MRKLISLIVTFTMLTMSCTSNENQPFVPSISKKVTFTETDATNALKAFDTSFYSPTAHLFYATTEQNSLGAIWTQAIFWDIIMDAYKQTQDSIWRNRIDEIYQGAYAEYDAFNWENKQKWFIYDDMMWWIISLARAYEITETPVYLNTSVAGFNRVWRDAYDPVNGGMYWSFSHDVKNACINYPTVIAAMTLY
ncbi:MAG: glycoside hydrolase family 76 protein, partial [Bacteroidota bacterium]|nr:glycoside hydrolase family 76 protein [Bacteroidota bacterium]